jgi:release factor glutamine methyltransferase
MASGGHLLVETTEAQAPAAAEILAGSGLRPRKATDEDLEATVVIGRWSPVVTG